MGRQKCPRKAPVLPSPPEIDRRRAGTGSAQARGQCPRVEVLEEGRVLFLQNGAVPWAQVVRKEMPILLFVISHNIAEQRYMIHTIPVSPDSFKARADLPEAWAGLRDAQLAAVTGVHDAGFCHNGRFIASAKSYEGIRSMAFLALKALERQHDAWFVQRKTPPEGGVLFILNGPGRNWRYATAGLS